MAPIIIDKPSGHLFCFECSLVWCDHIQECIIENKDQEFIWGPEYSYWMVMVPYIPTAEIWVPVEINDELNKLGGRNVALLDPRSAAATGISLGTISPGEGRAVIRELLHNWFLVQISDTVTGRPITPFCLQGTHKPREESVFRKHMRDEKWRWAELWTLHWYNSCLSCKIYLDTVAGFVPEKV